MNMVHLAYDPQCPGCRARRALDWVERQIGRLDPLAAQLAEASPVLGADDPGQELLRRTMMGVPMNVGPLMKPAKYFYEELGGSPPKKKRKMSANGKKRAKLMSKNLKIANARGRKKNGEYKKGWGQSRIMSTAHRMTRRDMNA